MKATIFPVLSAFLCFFATSLSNAADGGSPPSGAATAIVVSADDFDWRDLVPYLFAATTLPGEQGIRAVLENSSVLRSYVVNELRAECKTGKGPCKMDRSALDEEVSKRIGDIVREGIFSQHKEAIVDYTLARKPFPFSELAAVKNEKHADTYFMLSLADRSYTAADVQAKYGTPYDTDIVQWYSVYKYRLDSPLYTSKAVFEIDPVDGAVIKIAISLKPKKGKKGN
ncbi:MAG TPA: hypothetical protein VKR57_11495 [Terriglobales bacterium]|jgi:hypothetical protein|nr:hypothetical protein [Terriglobales bacterium]